MLVTIDYTRYPNGDDVVANLIGGNYYPTDTQQQQVTDSRATLAAEAASAEFELRTGWEPFLADTTATTRNFTATNGEGYLDLEGALVSLSSVVVNGAPYVDGSQFWTQPANALSRRKPLTGLQFSRGIFNGRPYAQPARIAVTGRWGRVETVPPDVWNALLRYAMVQVMTAGNQDQDIISWSEDGFSEALDAVGVIDPKTSLTYLPKEFNAAVQRWVRIIS